MKILTVILFSFFCLLGCSQMPSVKMANSIDLNLMMDTWYVQAGRFTFLEKEVHNGVEIYKWNTEKNQIDIDFTFNQGSFDGPKKSLPQKGWVFDKTSNAHWKVSPMWPLKFDYLILARGDLHEWVAIGVPNQNYLWIMTKKKFVEREYIDSIVQIIASNGYRVDNLVYVPHK